MANEFIIKNGFHSKGDSQVTGSLNISDSLTVNGSAVGAAFPFTGDAQITGSLLISGSKIHLRGESAIPGPILELESIGGSSGKDVYVKVGDASENYAYAFGADDSGNSFRIAYGAYDSVALGGNDRFIIDNTGNIEIPAGDISGSATSTASFGHYIGDGSQLTNLPASSTFPFTGDAQITGSLTISGSFEAFKLDADDIVLGSGAGEGMTSSDQNNIIIGTKAVGSGNINGIVDTIAIGHAAGENLTTGDNNILIGSGSGGILTTGYENIMIGDQTNASTNNTYMAIVIGQAASVTSGTGAIAIGRNSVSNSNSVAIGSGANTNSTQTVTIGQAADSNAARGIALGQSARQDGYGGIAIGYTVTSNAGTGVAIGYNFSNTLASSFQWGATNQKFTVTTNTNVVLNNLVDPTAATHFDDSATNVITIGTGSAPDANVAHSVQLYAQTGSSEAGLQLRTSGGKIHTLADKVDFTTATAISGSTFSGSFVGDGSQLTNLPTSSVLTSSYTSEWVLGADGTDHYTFSGPGLTGAENDPDIYLVRGQKYRFYNNSGGHPFRIQSTPNGSAGTAYNDGVTNNDAGNGTYLLFDVQFDAPTKLYYQCTSHANMGGPIYIADAIEHSGSFSGSFQGDGSALTGISSDPFPFTGDAQITGSLVISASNNTSESLSIEGSGSTIFSIQGSQGQLFSVTDDLLDEVFSVADISGDTLLSVSGSGLVEIPVGDLSGSATATASYGAFIGSNFMGTTGSFSHLQGNSPITVGDNITFQQSITASGDISASGGSIIGDNFANNNPGVGVNKIAMSVANRIDIAPNNSTAIRMTDSLVTLNKDTSVSGDIDITGKALITGSLNITGSIGMALLSGSNFKSYGVPGYSKVLIPYNADTIFFHDENLYLEYNDAGTDQLEAKIITDPSSGTVDFVYHSNNMEYGEYTTLEKNVSDGEFDIDASFANWEKATLEIFSTEDSSYPTYHVTFNSADNARGVAVIQKFI